MGAGKVKGGGKDEKIQYFPDPSRSVLHRFLIGLEIISNSQKFDLPTKTQNARDTLSISWQLPSQGNFILSTNS